jgi:hypothetical protein
VSPSATLDGLEAHIREFFAGHAAQPTDYALGDGRRGSVSGLRILEIAPGPHGDAWAYATCGASPDGAPREFALMAPVRETREP